MAESFEAESLEVESLEVESLEAESLDVEAVDADAPHPPESIELRIVSARARLDTAESQGLLGFDRPRARFVRTLLDQAGARPLASERIVQRAEARLAALLEDFDEAKESARAVLESVGEAGDPGGFIKRAFLTGDYRGLRRAVRRRRERESRDLIQARQRARVESLWVSRRGRPLDEPSASLQDIAEELYLDRRGEKVAREVLERVHAELPEIAGPYHAPTVAARVLDYLDGVSRPLLRAWLQRLDNIAALEESEHGAD